jgi:hypothetical protein
MGPREEDNGVLLLVVVTLVCGLIAVLPGLLEPTASVAAARPPTHVASQEAVRVIGTPFVPNINPRQR